MLIYKNNHKHHTQEESKNIDGDQERDEALKSEDVWMARREVRI